MTAILTTEQKAKLFDFIDQHGLFTPALHDGTVTMFFFYTPLNSVGVKELRLAEMAGAAQIAYEARNANV